MEAPASTAPLEPGVEPPGAYTLLVLGQDLVATVVLPPSGSIVVGRAADCAVRVDEPTVSRYHARISIGDGIAVEDLGSANGTQVAAGRVRPGVPAEVRSGEAIRIGSLIAVVQRRAPARPGPGLAAGSGAGGAMAALRALVERVAPGDVNVLIEGETGAGKEVLATELHRRSRRADRPMVGINCAALSETLLESELFGHERGAFTGATDTKPGLLEVADGGTILLDEIGEMPLPMQAKLLRVVEQREVTRVGGLKPRPLDARFLAATNRDLEAAVARREFRSDLYYRLGGVRLRVPPLRERRDELAALAAGFIDEHCARHGRAVPRLAPDARAALEAHGWPGNIRELRNVIEHALLLAPGDVIEVVHLPGEKLRAVPGALPPPGAPSSSRASSSGASPGSDRPASPAGVRTELRALERRRMIDALASCGGNQSSAAVLVGVPRRTFLKRLDAYEIPRPRKSKT